MVGGLHLAALSAKLEERAQDKTTATHLQQKAKECMCSSGIFLPNQIIILCTAPTS